MQYNDSTFYLDIKDPELNIVSQHYEVINGVNSKIIKVQRNQVLCKCPDCGKKTKRVHDYREQRIKHAKLAGYNTYIVYRKRRYICMFCNKRFYEPNFITQKHGKLSSNLKLVILELLKKKLSMKEIAELANVSSSTILRILKSLEPSKDKIKLSEVLCIDEFKSVKNVGNYSFILADPIEGKIIDILPTRLKNDLISYFNSFDQKQRNKVKYVIMDLWPYYREVVKKMFPNAKIIADKFHYVRQVYWAFNSIRIKVQTKLYHTNRFAYNLLKKNWKALIAYSSKLDGSRTFYSRQYKRYVSIFDIIDDCLQASDELAQAYALKEQFYAIIHNSNYKTIRHKLDDFINTLIDSNLPEFNAAITAFTNWKEEIINSFIPNQLIKKVDTEEHHFTNGYIEGLNNFIKVLKRVAFGYRNFDNFKTRILYVHNSKHKQFNQKKMVA